MSEQENRDYALYRNSGIHMFHPFLPFSPETTISSLRRKVYVSWSDLLGIRSGRSESVILIELGVF